jgi:protein translocase SecG subunit
MQRPSEDAGMGSALGGGAVTSIFGGEAGNVLHRWTIVSTILFFIISFILSLLYMAREGKKEVVMDLIASLNALGNSSSQLEEETIKETEISGIETHIDDDSLENAETSIFPKESGEEENPEGTEQIEEI